MSQIHFEIQYNQRSWWSKWNRLKETRLKAQAWDGKKNWLSVNNWQLSTRSAQYCYSQYLMETGDRDICDPETLCSNLSRGMLNHELPSLSPVSIFSNFTKSHCWLLRVLGVKCYTVAASRRQTKWVIFVGNPCCRLSKLTLLKSTCFVIGGKDICHLIEV